MNNLQSPQSSIVVFTDLDDTLIQTLPKVPKKARKIKGAVDREGQPLSFFTPPQKAMLDMFAQNALIIPVTGRNSDALNRVEYDFNHLKIVSHGAVVLRQDGRLCDQWLSEIQDELAHWPQRLEQSQQEIQHIIQHFDLDARSRVIIDQTIPAYVSIKGKRSALETIRQHHSLDSLYYRHENGRNHALLPPYTRKERAVRFVSELLGIGVNDLTIGIGDSLSDLDFMHSCKFAMMPTTSQIVTSYPNDESLN